MNTLKEKIYGFRACDNKGFHIKFENGWIVSVQFGAGNYCDNYNDIYETDHYEKQMKEGKISTNAEVWCWSAKTDKHYPKDKPLSHQTPKDVLKILNKVSKFKG